MSIRPFLPLLATVIVIAVNAAANIVPINGMNTGELSDLYPTGFTPPGYVFSIWSVIYLGLLAFGVAAWRGAPNLRARITEIQTPFLINAVGNAAWIFVWHYRLIAVSVAVMLVIRPPFPAAAAIRSAPWWNWIGGPLGALIVLSGAFLTPKLGSAAFIAAVIAGQVVCSLLLDHFGWMDLVRQEITPGRAFGAVLVVSGVLAVRYL